MSIVLLFYSVYLTIFPICEASNYSSYINEYELYYDEYEALESYLENNCLSYYDTLTYINHTAACDYIEIFNIYTCSSNSAYFYDYIIDNDIESQKTTTNSKEILLKYGNTTDNFFNLDEQTLLVSFYVSGIINIILMGVIIFLSYKIYQLYNRPPYIITNDRSGDYLV
jgi:hypothetical protein